MMGPLLFQIFPINIKGPAGSLVSSLDWFSSWVVAYTFNLLFEWSSAGEIPFIISNVLNTILIIEPKKLLVHGSRIEPRSNMIETGLELAHWFLKH